MLYENYQRKIAKISALKKWIKRYRIFIIIAAAIAFALLTSFLSVKGVVYSSTEVPAQITYGEDMPFSANAFFGKISYEYAPDGTDEWSEATPKRTGDYLVRAKSSRIFGAPSYSKAQPYKILPKAIDVAVSQDSVQYGDKLQLSADLMFDDSIDCDYFSYENLPLKKTQVSAEKSAVIISDKQGKNVTDSYILNIVSSEITLIKRTITVTVADATAVYDGTALSFDGCEVSNGSLATGDNLLATFDKTRIDAGEIENTAQIKIATADGDNVTDFYDIEVISGKLTVEKRPVYIKTQSAEKVYDGMPLSLNDYLLSAETSLVDGHRLELKSGASLTNVGTCENLLVFKVTDGKNDVTQNYSFLFPQDSKLKITPRTLTIKTDGASKTYDGLPLLSSGYTIDSQLQPLNNHLLKLSFGGSQTRAGSSKNTVSQATVTEDGKNVTLNYAFNYIYGDLSVAPRAIKVRTATAEFVYNGKEQYDGGAEVVLGGGLASGELLRAVAPATITNFGEGVVNEFAVQIIDGTGNDVSDCYIIGYEYGLLSMTKSTVEVTTATAELSYSGKEQSNGGHTVSPSIAEGQTSRAIGKLTTLSEVEMLGDGSFTKHPNIFEIAIFSGNDDVTYNYNLSYKYGMLSMHHQKITIATNTAEWEYDSLPHDDPRYTITVGVLGENHAIRISSNTKTITDVGVKANEFSIEIYSGEENVTSNYRLGYEYGILTIIARKITVTTNTAQWEYDSLPHDEPRHEITFGSLVGNHASVILGGKATITDVGNKENRFGIDIYSGEISVMHNYEISYQYGTLTILPRKITVTTLSHEWTYDGLTHSEPRYEISFGNLVGNHYSEISSEIITITNKGSKENIFSIEILSDVGSMQDKTANYEISYIYGTLTILPRQITITTNTRTWEYDGLTHLDSGYVITSDGLVNGHRSIITSEVFTIINVGSKENKLLIEILYGAENVTENYQLTYNYGTIAVTPRPITIKLLNESKQYNGTPLTSLLYKITLGSIVEGQWAEIQCSGSQTEIGSSANNVTKFTIFIGDEDVTYNYAISIENATLTVVLRHLRLYADNASKLYDGQELISNKFNHVNLLGGHNVWAEVLGSQTEIGIGENKIVRDSVRITANGVDVSGYYDIVFYDGELHVGEREITLKTFSSEKAYDGKPLTDKIYEIIGELLPGHKPYVWVHGSRTTIGSSTNDASVQIRDSAENDVTEYYLITYDFGKLTVTGVSGDINTDGSIDDTPSSDNEANSKKILFKATSDTSGKVYFRVKSFGDYKTNKWNDANPYLDGNMNALQLMYLSLSNSGKKTSSLYIETVSMNLSYMLPYYARSGYGTLDDTRINIPYDSPYDFQYTPYTYKATDKFSLKGTSYESFERDYYNYVLETYMQLPEQTRLKLLEVAAKNNLKAGSPTIISDVAEYVQNAVKYDLNYNKYLGDIAVYFFTKAETGICQHYATAATAMFRALGIPSRYVIGFVGDMSAGKTIDVSAAQAHAWVEVYLPGAGWVQIEVTGAGNGSGAGGGSGSGSGGGGSGGGGSGSGGGTGESENIPMNLTIKPIDLNKPRDDKPLVAKNEVEGYDLDSYLLLQNLLDSGYRYSAVVTGSRITFGVSESLITDFVLYDNYGRNVTENFKIEYKPGRLRITNKPININLYNLEKYYDGTPLSYESQDYWLDNLPSGFRLDFNLSGTRTEAGMLMVSELERLSFKLYDNNNLDVSEQYSLIFVGKPLRIYRRAVELTSASVTKTYDGKELTNNHTWISKGYLPAHNRYEATVTGKITDIGAAKNTIYSVRIYDLSGKDVTLNYSITAVYGILKIDSPV